MSGNRTRSPSTSRDHIDSWTTVSCVRRHRTHWGSLRHTMRCWRMCVVRSELRMARQREGYTHGMGVLIVALALESVVVIHIGHHGLLVLRVLVWRRVVVVTTWRCTTAASVHVGLLFLSGRSAGSSLVWRHVLRRCTAVQACRRVVLRRRLLRSSKLGGVSIRHHVCRRRQHHGIVLIGLI